MLISKSDIEEHVQGYEELCLSFLPHPEFLDVDEMQPFKIKSNVMETRKDIDGLAFGLVTITSLIWGIQQVLIKAVSSDMSPVLQIALRSGVAALLLAIVMLVRKDRFFSGNTWKPGLMAGILFAFEFFLIGQGLRYTTASHMIVFLYSAPIFVALILHFSIRSERLKSVQWIGIVTAFLGIAFAFLWRDTQEVTSAVNMIIGDLLALCAAITWALTTVLIRSSSLAAAPATQTLLYQLAVCFVVVLIAAVLTGQTEYRLTLLVASNLAFQGIVVSFGSFLLWFWLLRQYSSSQIGVFTFMTPLFGVLFSVWLLNEPLEEGFIFGSVLVMTGIFLMSSHSRIQKKMKIACQK